MIGCGKHTYNRIDAELMQYVIRFMRDADAHHVSYNNIVLLHIRFVSNLAIEQSLAARCYNHTIEIDRAYYESINDSERYEMMLHELGHCLYHMQHVTDYRAIMYPVIHLIYDESSVDCYFNDARLKVM